jgi:hypothetical protein
VSGKLAVVLVVLESIIALVLFKNKLPTVVSAAPIFSIVASVTLMHALWIASLADGELGIHAVRPVVLALKAGQDQLSSRQRLAEPPANPSLIVSFVTLNLALSIAN